MAVLLRKAAALKRICGRCAPQNAFLKSKRKKFEKIFENFWRIFVPGAFSVLGVVEGGSALSNFISGGIAYGTTVIYSQLCR